MEKESERGSPKGRKERVRAVCVRALARTCVYADVGGREKERKRERESEEKGKSMGRGRGKYREGGPPLTKDGVKMEGEKCEKEGGDGATLLSRLLSGVPMGIRLREAPWKIPKSRRWHPQGARQLFKAISISGPKWDISLFNAATYRWKYLESIVSVRDRREREAREGNVL